MKNKVKIFYGPAESGKSRAAREYAEGKKTVFLDGRKFSNRHFDHFCFSSVEADTELIIIDDIPIKEFRKGYFHFYSDQIKIDKKWKVPFLRDWPEVIIIICSDSCPCSINDSSITRRFDFTVFPLNQPV